MKILHAHKYFHLRRGAERYMLGLMRLQEQAGHIVAPFSMHYPHNLPSTWEEFFVSEINTEAGVGRGLNAWRQFRRAWWSREAERKMEAMLEAFQPDIVHVHNIYTQISPSILRPCRKRKIPVVMTLHDYALVSANYALWAGDRPMDLNHLGLFETARTKYIKNSYLATLASAFIQKWHQFFKTYQRSVDLFLPVSNFVREVYAHAGFNENQLEVVYPFANLPQAKPVKDQGYILYVGSLEKNKGVQTLIEAMRTFPGVPLKIAGQGPAEQELKDLARDLPGVEFLGFVAGEALTELMSAAQAVVVPSIWYEPFGLVAVEAMSCGTPVIVSDRGGLPEIVEHGLSGRVFKAGDANDLRDRIKEILFDDHLVQALGEVAQERARALADPAAHLERILSIYSRIIAQK